MASCPDCTAVLVMPRTGRRRLRCPACQKRHAREQTRTRQRERRARDRDPNRKRRPPPNHWTDTELGLLADAVRQNRRRLKSQRGTRGHSGALIELAAVIGRTPEAVRLQASRCGLHSIALGHERSPRSSTLADGGRKRPHGPLS